MSPDRQLGLSPWYEITDLTELKEAVMNLSRRNVIEAGPIIEARIKEIFADDEKQRGALLDHLATLAPRHRRRLV